MTRHLALLAICALLGCTGGPDDTAATDADGDGFLATDDCDDSDPEVHPEADEIAGNDVDEDCDGQLTCYVDADGDSYGADAGHTTQIPLSTTTTCDDAANQVADDTDDCLDTSEAAGIPAAEIHPGATEVAGNDVDENCDDQLACHVDEDGDGYGAPDGPTPVISADASCDDPENQLADDGTDCLDAGSLHGIAAADIHPGATEYAGNPVDEDCDGQLTCHRDSDGDGYGRSFLVEIDLSVTATCDAPASRVADDDTDCADLFYVGGIPPEEIHPGARETPGNDVDEDCDDQLACYVDADGDGFGAPTTTHIADTGGATCDDPGSQLADDADDCLDTGSLGPWAAAEIHPDSTETPGNDIDEDCDGQLTCYVDSDGDGYGDPATTTAAVATCDTPASHVADDADDCDDTSALLAPGATLGVPSDFATIQAAIDAACEGSTIQVGAGTYAENVDYGGNALTVQGTARDEVVIAPASGLGVRIDAGALRRVTVAGAERGIWAEGDGILLERVLVRDCAVADGEGGGIRVDGTAAELYDVEVRDSSAERGGGLAVYATDAILDGLWVEGNVATGATSDSGGLYLQASGAVVRNATFLGNVANQDPAFFAQLDATFEHVLLEGNVGNGCASAQDATVTGLAARHNYVDAGTCIELSVSDAGGITVQDVEVGPNLSPVASSGVGFYDLSGEGAPVVAGDIRVWGHHTGIHSSSGQLTLQGVVAAGGTFGLLLEPQQPLALENVTAVDQATAGIHLEPAAPVDVSVTNAIAWGNATGLSYSAYSGDGGESTLSIAYSDVAGNDTDYVGLADPTGTDGNVSVDPAFVSWAPKLEPGTSDLHLAPGSPLIDAGDPAIADPDGSTSDMGAYGGPAADSTWYDDLDADGMYDGWERARGLHPSADDSADNPDGDALDNLAEFQAGTHPWRGDTDGDGTCDGTEVDAQLDPLDPDDAGTQDCAP